jgi:hypothetical protein
MNTLIIPCAGRSTRFPDMKPKWMLTHPDGSIMVEKSMDGMPLEMFDRIIVTIVKEHADKYEARKILEQVFGKSNQKVEILELDDFTSCQAETIYLTLLKKEVTGNFVVKDSDNRIVMPIFTNPDFVVGLDINKFNKEIFRLKAKSFLIVNEQGIVTDIIEKKIISENICLGVYGFSDTEKFIDAYKSLLNNGLPGEIYLSHVVSYLIGSGKSAYSYIEAHDFEDWGTLVDWKNVQNNHSTYFIDIDGVMLKNKGKYGVENWSNCLPAIDENIAIIKQLHDKGAQIVFTTSRSESDLDGFKELINKAGIKVHSYVAGCNHAPRIIINDFAPTNPYPSCRAINIPRNNELKSYL